MIVMVSDVLEADTLPIKSVTVEVIDQSPSAKVPRSQLEADPATYEQFTVTPARVAETVTVNPDVTPGTEIAGVLSPVTLSVGEAPVSDELTKSGAAGASGGGSVVNETVLEAIAPRPSAIT